MRLDRLAVRADVDWLKSLARRIDDVYGEPVWVVVGSVSGARLVDGTLERAGWKVEIAGAQKLEGPGAAGLLGRRDRLAAVGDAV